jgi:LuxR family maltose regulon positive regulatory protein
VEQLLTTKLYIPPTRPELVPRARLIEQMNEGLHRKLTLISAPAGFGKTTLVTEWLDNLRLDTKKENQIKNRIAWLSLDEGDNDPARFLSYFIAALNQVEGIDAAFGKGALSMLQSPQPPPSDAILTSLINEFAEITDKFIFVLDDYHLIDAQPIHEAFTFLLEHLPPQLHLVIATREDPNLPLSRLRARGQLTELRATNLRFSSSEAADFLNQVMGLNLSAEDITALEKRTEGWIAGLQLAAISLQGQEDTASLIKSFTGSHRLVLDYLIEEVLDQQSGSVQTFLLQTAILNQMTSSLCDAITGQDNSQATLETLERANLFIVPLDEERRWYRYHHLFGDLLRERLKQTQPKKLPILNSLASKWFEQQGLIDEAIEHALQSDNFDQAARMIDEHIEERWQRGKLARLWRWLDKLPDELVYNNPNLCIFLAWNLFINGNQEKAEESLQAAEKKFDLLTETLLEKQPEEHEHPSRLMEKKVRGRAAAIRAVMATYRSDADGSMKSARLALELLPGDDLNWRSAAATALADAYVFMGEYDRAHQARFESLKISKTAGNTYLYLIDSTKCVLVLKARGELQQAREFCQQQILFAKDKGFSKTGTIGWMQAILGEILAETNDMDGAYEMVRVGVNLTERGRDVALLSWSYMCLTRVLHSLGDQAGAEKIINKTKVMAQETTTPPWVNNQIINWQVRIWLAQGRLDEALKWMQEQGADSELETTYVGNMIKIPLARIQIAQGLLEKTNQILLPLLEAAEAGGHISRVIEILMLQALAFQVGGDTAQAMTTLEKALTLAEPGGFIRIFVDEGPPMARLLYKALSRGIAPDYVRRLLAAFPVDEPEQTDPSKSQVPKSELVEPLSEREIEVLQLIAEGLTNPEIAARLYLSLNTVKVHTRNIYGKLGVNNRTQAGTRAKALGILPPT